MRRAKHDERTWTWELETDAVRERVAVAVAAGAGVVEGVAGCGADTTAVASSPMTAGV